MNRVAFVIPWFGKDLVGGAERVAYQAAIALSERGHAVEVLSTCSASASGDWGASELPEGVTIEDGITVRRFKATFPHPQAFAAAHRECVELNDQPKRIGLCPVSEEAAYHFVHDNIQSPGLLAFLARQQTDYRAVIFLPYLYGPTLAGLPIVRGAFLQPLLHDETYAYLPAIEELFHQAHGLLFASPGELALAARLYGPGIHAKATLVGVGLSSAAAPESVDGLESNRFLLYLGRRGAGKNTPLLLAAYQTYRLSREAAMPLVLAGPREQQGVEAPGVVDLGVVSEAQKEWLLANCRALLQPSKNESFSLSIFEAWRHRRPVVAHRDCGATRGAVDSAAGGWLAGAASEWSAAMGGLHDADPRVLAQLGERGCSYAAQTAGWPEVVRRYEQALGLGAPSAPRVVRKRPTPAVHQVVAGLAYGDAISNQAIFIRRQLQALGFRSEIFAPRVYPAMQHIGRMLQPGAIAPDAAIIYHHSIGSNVTAACVAHPGPKALIYHSITPARFMEPWRRDLALTVEQGRRDLPALALEFPLSYGDSKYNVSELAAAGFLEPEVFPPCVDPGRWDHPADGEWMDRLQDGSINVLFVGRMAPNKCQHDLIRVFAAFSQLEPTARLVVAGAEHGDSYAQFVRREAERLRVSQRVVFLSEVDESVLAACYRTAHLYVSMSDHEGFGVPLIEAMWFGIPVLAYRSSAVPETLGPAGLLVAEKDGNSVAELMRRLLHDHELRREVLDRQEARRQDFLPAVAAAALARLTHRLERSHPLAALAHS